jgi:Ni,Fe-hydrogenase III large subunit
MTQGERITPRQWRAAIERALADGDRFAGAWVSERARRPTWRALFMTSAGPRILSTDAVKGAVQSITDLVPAADWDEREAHDLYGLQFAGHEPMRALVTHTDDPEQWMTPVSGDGVHQVAVGPIHAGVIESGHFRFHVVGERILVMDPRLFYKHRGLERAAEGHAYGEAHAHVQRACAACAVSNTLAYAQAIEEILGLAPDRELRVARTVLLELERVYNHLHDISAICAGVGFAAGVMAFAAFKDRAQQINARAFGHRFLFDTIAVGEGAVALDSAATYEMRTHLAELRADTATAWRELEFAGSLQARLAGVGVLDPESALSFGTAGPAARAAGIRDDVRTASPHLAYEEFAPAMPESPDGDVAARFRMRAIELEASLQLLESLLAHPHPLARGEMLAAGAGAGAGSGSVATTTTTTDHSAIGIGRVESPRGATVCAVELDGGRIARVHLRTASYANWPALAHAAAGTSSPTSR